MIDHNQNLAYPNQYSNACFHCGLPVPENQILKVTINGHDQLMCCAGCQAVASTIVENGLTDYYQYRNPDVIKKPQDIVPEIIKKNTIYDRANIRSKYIKQTRDGSDEITLMLEGLTCVACAWLIEKQLLKQVGIISIEVNYTSMIAQLKWNQSQIPLSQILTLIRQLGYIATPYEPRIQYKQQLLQRSQQLRRIGITAVLAMQIMIISVALYFGHYTGMDENWKVFFHKLGLLFTLPIIFYSANTFFKASWYQLRSFQAGMDVPVCLGLSLAFISSIWTLITGNGDVYYDSIAMFVFLLLIARYFMHSSILTASHSVERLAANTPLWASRLTQHSVSAIGESVTAEELLPGDWVRVLANDVIPADGIVVSGNSSINQSMISGESKPVQVSSNDQVLAGSVNNNSPLIIKVTASGKNTVYSAIEKMTKQGLAQQISNLPLIDLIARWFVCAILIIAISVAVYWWYTAPEHWLATTVAVLVVSCPCALSLSVPCAYAATTSNLIDNGLMLTNTAAIERLSSISHVIFDKTGTLTSDTLKVSAIQSYGKASTREALRLAASMEINTDHPLAKAICAENKQPLYESENWTYETAQGISARINATDYFIGSAKYIQQKTGLLDEIDNPDSIVLMANQNELLARFEFKQDLRDGVYELIEYFKSNNKSITMLTGDTAGPANSLANEVGIEDVYSECKPEDKLRIVKTMQAEQNACVLMIGDGINDSPVLAAANVSIAVAGASPLAITGADVVMAQPGLGSIISLLKHAKMTAKIIRQNISWAVGYNLVAIPFAASGLVTPLLAAIGMSLSSIIVVLNAQRLRKNK